MKPPGQTCANCSAYIPDQDGQAGNCQAHPADPILIGVNRGRHKITNKEVHMPDLIWAIRRTQPQLWCREWGADTTSVFLENIRDGSKTKMDGPKQ